ncbi:MAG TPA: 50S ribosomal protein L25/general stress protein Ctc [Bacteroidia bacterium]|nr:50S ribosomal protein L25/general stress protein Ctc [Bacteroidia bacterium]
MKSISIEATKRTVGTKQAVKLLRTEGKIPCVLYGGKDVIHFTAPILSFRDLVYTPHVYTVDLSIDGEQRKAIMKEIQFHGVTDKILHIDFLELTAGKPVVMDIPLKFTGSAEGVREGGELRTKLRKLKVKALAENLPDEIELDVSKLNISEAIRVKDVKIKGCEILDLPNNIITAVKMPRVFVEETPVVAVEGAVVPGAEGIAPAIPGAPAAPGAAPAPAPAAAPAKK